MPTKTGEGSLGQLLSRLRRTMGPEEMSNLVVEVTGIEEPGRLHVTSHVGRDLLQNAAYFNSLPKVVNEYVSNAIDNAPEGKAVRCWVTIRRDRVEIKDYASGMSYEELHNFFRMHGENIQRQRGRKVRGKFGTGKSAAFGIANTLRVETVKSNKLNIVELRREDVERVKGGQPIPVRELVVNQPVRRRNGTIVTVEDLNIDNVDAAAVRTYLERSLGRHLDVHQVKVNGELCRYIEPESVRSYQFEAPEEVVQLIGPVMCTIKVAKEPVDRPENGIAILCNGFLNAMTKAGQSRKPFFEYIFGAVDVPALDADDGPIPPFDNTRDLSLNPQNPMVRVLEEWLGQCIEEVRQELVARERQRQRSWEYRRLRKAASEIETLINADFEALRTTMPWLDLATRKRRRSTTLRVDEKPPTLLERGKAALSRLFGTSEAARPENDQQEQQRSLRKPPARVEFRVTYRRLGEAAPRSRYIEDQHLICLNRDHPQFGAAEAEAGIDSWTFKLISREIVFTEYALAVVSRMAEEGIEIGDPLEASEMIQDIIDRLSRKAAQGFELSELRRQSYLSSQLS